MLVVTDAKYEFEFEIAGRIDAEDLLSSERPQMYDVLEKQQSSLPLGPCLLRCDYEREPPKTWTRLRREIGWISFDASLLNPTYHLNKSFKRYVHLPAEGVQHSYHMYHGYEQFVDEIRRRPDGYFRSFDSIDMRPLLHWYSNKQHLFSVTDSSLLKPPTFLCRRLVLRTILTNLYCDSEPWKLLVVRIKGQFYLAMANRATQSAEQITEDEYSGYRFESLFTSDQPNSTRLKDTIPLEQPQKQFHSVQYWEFGRYSLLYTNEIDGELHIDAKQPSADRGNDVPKSQVRPWRRSTLFVVIRGRSLF
jgi:hypothetical protein